MEITYVLNSRMPTEEAHGIQTVRMCEAFRKHDCQVNLLHANRRQPTRELREISVEEFYDVKYPFEVHSVPYFNGFEYISKIGMTLAKPLIIFGNLSFALTAAVGVKQVGGDYVITREWQVATFFVLLGMPTIYSAHTVDAMGFTSRARTAIGTIADWDALRLIVTNSQGTAEGMRDIGVPEDKILAHPNGVDLNDYEQELDRRTAREKVGLPTDDSLLVYTGSLIEQKGAYVLADASESIDGKVVLVGGEPEEIEAMEAYVRENELDDVIIVGYVNPRDISTYQFAADVLALPPLSGNYDRRHQAEYTSPLKLFEYMAANRPIVASDIPALHEVLTHEETALFTNPGDPEAFSEAVSRLFRDRELCELLTQNATEAVQEYTWQDRAQRILGELQGDTQ